MVRRSRDWQARHPGSTQTEPVDPGRARERLTIGRAPAKAVAPIDSSSRGSLIRDIRSLASCHEPGKLML